MMEEDRYRERTREGSIANQASAVCLDNQEVSSSEVQEMRTTSPWKGREGGDRKRKGERELQWELKSQ